MELAVVKDERGYRLHGPGPDIALLNRFLEHLEARAFSPATMRAYAYDLLNFGRFLTEGGLILADVQPSDLFDYLDWQARPKSTAGRKVVRLHDRRGRRRRR